MRPGFGVARKPPGTTTAAKGTTPSGTRPDSLGQTCRKGSPARSVRTSSSLRASKVAGLTLARSGIHAVRSRSKTRVTFSPAGSFSTLKKLDISRASRVSVPLPVGNAATWRKAGLKGRLMMPLR